MLSTDLENVHFTSNTFDVQIPNFYVRVNNSSLIPNKNGLYVVGSVRSSLSDGNENESDGYVMYFDSNGDKVWERFINDDGIYNDISQYDPNDDRSR